MTSNTGIFFDSRLGGVAGSYALCHRIAERILEELREVTNKAWVLGSESFKVKIAEKVGRYTSPKARGGDRKSKAFQKNRKSIEFDPVVFCLG